MADAQIHSLGAYREMKGEPVKPRLVTIAEHPSDPIPLIVQRIKAKLFGAKDRLELPQAIIEERHAQLLANWVKAATEECGLEAAKKMLESKVHLLTAVMEARK